MKIIDIEFSQPKLGLENAGSPARRPGKRIPVPTDEERKAFLTGLETIFPKSAVLATCFPQRFAGDSSVPQRLPHTITSLYHPKYKKLSRTVLAKECDQVFGEELKVTSEESKYLSESTRLQAQSSTWYEHRKG